MAEAEVRRLAGADLVLTVPGSLAERFEVYLFGRAEATRPRAMLGALGLCWDRFRRRHPYNGNLLAYGGLVLDTLVAEGATLGEVMGVAPDAFQLCIEHLVPVEGTADFSGTPAAGSTSGG